MDLSKEQSYFTEPEDLNETYVKDYTEAEVEEYLKFINNNPANAKVCEINTTFELENHEGLEDSLHKLYIEDLAKDYQECSFTYQPKDNNLSIVSMKDRLLSIIETNSVVVIQGPTGCGKTTQIPQFILDDSIKKRLSCNIIVTQPRRIAAINIAKRVSQEGGWPLGSLIGYKVGMRSQISCETRLLYCTTEILLNILINDKHMLRYTHVILDEIHERDQEMDFLLLVVKKLLQTNSRQVKVILMSATIDVMKYAKYFSTKVGNKLIPAPIVKIPEKRNFKICIYYLDEIENLGAIPEVSVTEPKITKSMIKFCCFIINALDQIDMNDNEDDLDLLQRHAVLIFLPGIYEIEEMYNYLSSDCYANKMWDLVILHSWISSDEQQRVFYKSPEGYRRIILSTNVAESSITVPDIKYVIDFCLTKVLEIDPVTHYQTLKLSWASKANCTQRAGRAGRVMNGRVYRLVSKAFYDNIFKNEGTPEMLRAPLANIVLRAKVFDLDEPRALLSLSLDPPSLSNLATTILTLKEVGALLNEDESFQPFDGKLTDLGRIMAYIPLDVRVTKLIMLGHVFGVLRDAIILGTSMAIKDIFNMQIHTNVSSYANRRKWAYDSDSDCISTLNVYKVWQNEKANRRLTTYQAERQWAQRNGVQLRTLRELDALVNETTRRLQKFGIEESMGANKTIWEDTDRDFVLQVILAGAFYPNYFIKRMQNLETSKEDTVMNLGTHDPMTTVYLRGWPIDQPGYLYAKKIQEIFAKHQGILENQIVISFDKSKRVYVQFHEKASNDNFYNISNFVYQSVKMRHCDVPIKINLLNTKEAQKRAKYYKVDKFERTFFFQKNSKKTESDRPDYKIRPKLPELDVIFIPLFIRTIISPGYFWATLDDEVTYHKLRMIENVLNKYPLKELSSSPTTSTIIAAPLDRKDSLIYHRAIIEDYTPGLGELVDIFFIDNGCTSRLRYSDLREINNITVLEIPPLALHCNLAFLRPSTQANCHGLWSKDSKMYFEMQLKKKRKFFGKIYSVVNNIINLELIAVNEKGEDFNINNIMIEKGYARRKEESYLSIYNHELRESINLNNYNAMSIEEKKFYEEEQYDKDYLLKYPDLPKEEEYSSTIKLQGPHSPLEMELIQLTSIGKSQRVSIDSNSVNCVLLDDDHDLLSRRLLVAQIVNQGPNGRLHLRNTTFLPNIPGLAALLALSFTPRTELRCNSRKTHYTGALCGLGPMNDRSGRAMFPDHDMEINFDVHITIDDIKEINKLRYWMNAGMQLDQYSNDNYIINCQNKLKHILLELRNKQRKPRNQSNDEVDYCSDKWNYYDKLYFIPSIRDTTGQCNIYPLHKALELREMNEKKEDMLDHLSKLQCLAYEDVLKMKNVNIFCKLCKVETCGLLELRNHLYSEQHTENEKTLHRIS